MLRAIVHSVVGVMLMSVKVRDVHPAKLFRIQPKNRTSDDDCYTSFATCGTKLYSNTAFLT